MDINLNNYEAFFLDYLEGNLNPSDKMEFEAFLKAHPLLNHEFMSEDLTPLKSEPHIYPNKNLLKKLNFSEMEVSESTIEDFCIAHFEFLLNPAKEKELFTFIEKNPNFSTELNLYSKVYIHPQLNIKFKNKKALYQEKSAKTLVPVFFKVMAAAACAALLIGVYFRYSEPSATKVPAANSAARQQNTPSITASRPINQISSGTKALASKHLNQLSFNKLIDSTSYVNSIAEVQPIPDNEPRDSVQVVFLMPRTKLLLDENNVQLITEKLEYLKPNLQPVTEKPHGIPSFALLKLKNNLGLEKIEDTKGRLSFFKVLQAGVKGINELTESNMELTEMVDEAGKMTALSFRTESGLLQVHHKFSKKE